MRTSEKADARDKSGKRTAYWQERWMTKVLCDGHCSFAKLLFMRIASFGARGCWMTNETIAEEFNRSERTIRRAVSSLWSSGELIVTGWNGHGRKMYVAGDPKVREELNRGCAEALAKGKIKTNEEWLAKIRLRVKSAQVQN